MHIKRLLQYAGWPIAAGIIIALSALLFFPELRGQQNTPAVANNYGSGPVSYANAVSHAAPAVVNIYTEKKVIQRDPNYYNSPYYRHFYNNSNIPLQQRMQKTLGSGVIVDVSGLILTNNHVINGADKIQVLLYDGRYTSAELVGIDTENDLAVLKINLEKLFAITPGRSKDIRVGDVVLAIGNPFGVGQSVSQGIVSATGRWGLGINDTENFIQTDAAVNPGNSGGALIDAQGNLIGINTAILDESGSSSVGISFAVPADTAMNSLKQIVQYGEVRRIWLGFTITQLYIGAVGLTVGEVEIGSPVAKAGLKPGDVITHINDHVINDVPTAKNIIGNIQPGTEIKIRIMREGKEMELTTIASLQPSTHTKT